MSKAVVTAHRINHFFGLRWNAVPTRFEMAPHSRLGIDLLLTCVDSGAARLAIGGAARRSPSTLWLDTGSGRENGQVVLGHFGREADSERRGFHLSNVLDLFPELISVDDAEETSSSTEEALRRQELPVNRVAATIALDLLHQLLRHGELATHGAQFSLAPLVVRPIPVSPEAWAFYGFKLVSA